MPSSPLLDAVLFDVDDTLYSTTEFADRARRGAVRAMIREGFDASEDEALQELTEVVGEFSSNYEHHLDRLIDRMGPERLGGHNAAVVIAAGVIAYHEAKQTEMQALPDALEVLQALHAGGSRLGVVSAGLAVKQAEKLLRIGVLRYFGPDALFFSEQLGVSKPNPKIYRKAAAGLQLDPARILYVGDRPTHDVEPARRAGMRTVLYRGAGGKYARLPSPVPADHEMEDMRELLGVLRGVYGLAVPGD